jgi:LmbE family N-acetylglucosaminyl deacetylase
MKKVRNNFAKNLIIGGLFLSIGGCQTTQYGMPNFNQQNDINQQSQKPSISYLKKDKPRNVLIIPSPHFDDAVLSVGGIISQFDGPKYIVTFFSSAPIYIEGLTNWDELSGFKESADSEDIREKENDNAAFTLGARVINKDYIDKQYETRSQLDNSTLVGAITKDIEQIITSMNDAKVTVIGPSYFGNKDTHPDHLLVSKALMQVARNKSNTNASFYFYEDEPYVQHKFGNEDITLDKILKGFYSGLHLVKREIAISKQAFKSKIRAIKSYTSQVKAFHNIKENLVDEITDYGMNRCQDIKPCEVIYEIKIPIEQ